MKVRARERIATAILLTVIGIIALAIWWTYAAVEDAGRQRREASEIARTLSGLRLATLEYALNHREQERAKWYEVSQRADRVIATARFSDATDREILAGVGARRIQVRQIFGELISLTAAVPAAADFRLNRSSEAQLLSRIFALQQENFTAAFRLIDLATRRANDAQRRLLVVILSGLGLIALIQIGGSWSIQRHVLEPVARLQHAAQQVAAGNWSFEFGKGGTDEIGQLTRDLGSMKQSLQNSLMQVERSNQELAALNRELEAFGYSVSHDLRGPLRAMDGFSLVLLEDYDDKLDDEGKDALRRIRAASQHMGLLIDDLLRLSQVARADLKLQPVDLSGIARGITASVQGDRSGRSVEWAIEDGMTITADPGLMQIAMQNLIANAWKFTARTENATICVGTLERDGRSLYFVADNGVGFDMAHAQRLFGAFQRLHRAADFPGTGIGLAITQRIIRRHDGGIWAEAREGKGATFFFTLGDMGHDHGRHADLPAA